MTTTTAQTYGSKASAVRGARRAGLQVDALTFVQDGMSWTWTTAAVAAEPQAEVAAAPAEESPEAMRARLEAENAAWLADDAVQAAPAVEIAQPGTLEAMIDTVAAEQAEAAEQVAQEAEKSAALTQTEALAAFTAEEAALNPARTYRVGFSFERAADHLALNAAQDMARKLGFSLQIITPTGEQMIASPKGKRAKSATVAGKPRREPKPAAERTPRAAATAPNGKTAKMIAMACRPEGVTRPQLAAEISDKAQPWTQMLKDAAEKWGYIFTSEREKGGNTVYRLTKIAA